MSCHICPRHCADRSTGVCGVGNKLLVARIAKHQWEEPVISGTNGSGTVFFSGCSLRCVFCQNHTISQELVGKEISPRELDEHIIRLIEQGVHNLNFVTPTHYALFLADFLQTHHYPVPIVYNSSGYEEPEVLEALRDKVQIFLPDLKYSDSALAKRFSAAPDYVEKAAAAIQKMVELVGDVQYDENGLLQKGVLVRHLMLPGYLENTLGVIDLFDTLKGSNQMLFSLMSQYTPMGRIEDFPCLQRRLRQEEYERALNYVQLLGIDGFCQSPDSAQEIYVPPFSAHLECGEESI